MDTYEYFCITKTSETSLDNHEYFCFTKKNNLYSGCSWIFLWHKKKALIYRMRIIIFVSQKKKCWFIRGCLLIFDTKTSIHSLDVANHLTSLKIANDDIEDHFWCKIYFWVIFALWFVAAEGLFTWNKGVGNQRSKLLSTAWQSKLIAS